MMQYMAKADSPTKGRDGTSHFGDIEKRNMVSPISMLGDLIPVLSGVALGARLQGRNLAVMTYIGDGGQSTGVTYEGINFAAVQNLGLVLFVESNLWAYSTPSEMQYRCKDLAERAIGYGIPGVIVDGTDACQVYDAAHEAVERAHAGEGPTLIEAKMMRMKGHAIHDAAAYVPKPMFDFWKKRDPIARFENYLVKDKKWLTRERERSADQRSRRSNRSRTRNSRELPHADSRIRRRRRLLRKRLPRNQAKIRHAQSEEGNRQLQRNRSRRAFEVDVSALIRVNPWRERFSRNSKQETRNCMQLTYLEAIRQGIWEEMDRDPTVFCLGEDIGIYGGAFKVTDGFIDRFGPERVIDTPIAESAIVGAAFGASLTGMRPVAEFQFMDFIGCAFNQISNMVAKTHYLWGAPAPLVLRGPSGGYVHGGPFHSQNPEMWFVHNPGLKVICPATPYDAKGLIKSAIRDNNPCIFFEHKYLYRRIKGEVPAEDYVVPIGKARVAREGKDLSIITYAAMVHTALEAAEILSKEGIDLEILDLRTVSPLDREAIAQTVKKTNKVIILHEHSRTGGLAGEIAAIINEEAFDDLDGPIVRIAGLDSAVPFSPPQEHHYLPKVEDVVRESRRLKAY